MNQSSKKIMVSQRYRVHYFSSFKELFRAFYNNTLDRNIPFDCVIEAYRFDSSQNVEVILYKEWLQDFGEVKEFYKHLNY